MQLLSYLSTQFLSPYKNTGLVILYPRFSGESSMTNEEVMKISTDGAAWQDYRASNTGMVVFYTSDPVSEIPIREVPEEIPSEVTPEPHYETGTYGFYGCSKSKVRNAFVKSKIRYLLFMTKYEGAKADFKEKVMITGFYKITKVADVKKMHIRYCSEYSCLDEDTCSALKAEEVRFVNVEDALILSPEVLKKWDYKTKITKQARILLNEDQTLEVVEYLRNKPDATSQYVAETARLWPHGANDESEGGEEE